MGCGKQEAVDERFAVTIVQSDLARSSGPHPIRRFAPPSPASWGRGPRGDLRCVNTVAPQGGRGLLPPLRMLPQAGQVILQPLSSTVPATSAPLTTLATLNRSSGAEPPACASPTKSEAMS